MASPITRTRASLADLGAVLVGTVLVVVAAVVGRGLIAQGESLFLFYPPLLAHWEPHVGAGTVPAVLIAVVVVVWGPTAAQRLGWGRLLLVSWLAAVGWTTALALVDGYGRGFAGRLTVSSEYLVDVPRVEDIGRMLAVFTDHILTTSADPWTLHVGAHPPGALLVFVWLDRVGLGGGAAAAALCVLVGSSATVAVATALRALGAEPTARAMLPFGVLAPAAVWIGVSGDGLFAGVLAWGVALLAIGATGTGRRADVAALAGGLLLGFTLYLSYGLVLGGLLPLAVLIVTRRVRAAVIGAAGVVAVVAAFTLAGFWWYTGFELLRIIYAESAAQGRPYSYFVWANLAAVVLVIGPAVLAGLRRLAANPVPRGLVAVTVAALLCVLIADLSGLSKAEVERIWLPFTVWLFAACALLPRPHVRGWLAAQALLALTINHLLFTFW